MNGARRLELVASTVLAGAMLALSGCATLKATLNGDGVTAPPNGGAVVLRDGAPLVVSLAPDPATGYGWVLTSSSPNLWAIGGPDYTPDPKPAGMMGVSGATTYRFRGRAPGPATIEFARVAPPGQSTTSAKVVRYDVTVTPSRLFGIQ